jgi:hypothetical protein
MLRSTLSWSIDVEKGSAKVEIPALVRDINFFPNNRHSKFSITISLGVVPDFKFNQATGKFTAPKWYDTMYGCSYTSSEWHSALKGSPATTLELSLDQLPPEAGYSLMLGIGICFGDAMDGDEVKQIKRAGAAKILGIVAGGNQGERERESENEVSDVVDDNVQAIAGETASEPSNDAQRLDQCSKLDAPTLLKKPQMREKRTVESVRPILYHYTVGNTYYRASVEEATYSYSINADLSFTWHHCSQETATILDPSPAPALRWR